MVAPPQPRLDPDLPPASAPHPVIGRLLKFCLRWSFRILVLGIALVALALFFRHELLREILLRRITAVTGLETQLGAVRTDTASRGLTLSNLLVRNSAEFGGTPLLRASELHLELDTDALRYREIRLRLARLRLEEFNVVRNARGETNVFALLRSVNTNATPADAVVVAPPGLEFTGIETLDLTFETLRFIDLAHASNSREIRVALTNEILREVRSTEDFAPLVLRVLVREIGAGLRSGLPLGPPSR